MSVYSKQMVTSFVGTLMLIACFAQTSQAHFIWIVPESTDAGTVVQVYFGEDASLEDPSFLKLLNGMKVWSLPKGKDPKLLDLTRTDDALFAKFGEDVSGNDILVASHDYGVVSRAETAFQLKYYAKAGPQLGSSAWRELDGSQQLRFNVIPEKSKTGMTLHVLFDGKAVAGSEVKASGPGLDDFTGTTGESGTVEIPISESGLYSIRAKHVEAGAGKIDGKDSSETRHYTTLALQVKSDSSPATEVVLQPLKQMMTSFGGAILDGNLYVYGGHTGSAHSYSLEEQGHTLEQLNLKTGKWQTIAEGPHLQGLALVSDGKKLYRIGGFTAKNAEGEEHDLWSQNSVAAFDVSKKAWTEMPALPTPRSSFDAAYLNGKIYVVGGWTIAGSAKNVWHKTALVLDLKAETPAWKELPTPPFQRRALAVAAYQGKIYAIGGMKSRGGPTRQIDVFDPSTGKWSTGPDIIGDDGMTGFGASAFATGDRLYVSTIKGDLQRLSKDGKSWEIARKTPTPRFFHRLLPFDQNQLLAVGGASMETGKFDEVEVFEVEETQ